MTIYAAGAAGGYGVFDNSNKKGLDATVSNGGTGGSVRWRILFLLLLSFEL